MEQLIVYQPFRDLSTCVQNICDPLLKHTDISTFGMTREYFDGRRIVLSTRGDWIENYFQKEYFGRVHQYNAFYHTEFTLWEAHKADEMVRDARVNFNIDHGITLCKFTENYVEFYHFSAKNEHYEIINWYINNLNMLRRFSNAFSRAIQKPMGMLKPFYAWDHIQTLRSYYQALQERRSPLRAEITHHNSWRAEGEYSHISLTAQETATIVQLLRGNTAKQAAKSLGLSPRTVEFYIQRIKKKFGCQNKSALLNMILKTNFVEDHPF